MTPQAIYIAAAYGISAVALAGLVLWIVLDERGRRRDLALLDQLGLRRRSDSQR